MTKSILTQSRLKELLHYCPDTGAFTCIEYRGPKAMEGDMAGGKTDGGYIAIRIEGISHKAHRLAFLYMTGSFPYDQVDHINGVRHENQWDNIREVTHKDNVKNKKLMIGNKSGISNIWWVSGRGKWRACISVDGKSVHLGYTFDFFEACCIRKSAEIKYGYHINHGR